MILVALNDPLQKVTAAERAHIKRCERAYECFSKLGWDTAKIAILMNTTEAMAERYVTLGRCRTRGLSIPYGVE